MTLALALAACSAPTPADKAGVAEVTVTAPGTASSDVVTLTPTSEVDGVVHIEVTAVDGTTWTVDTPVGVPVVLPLPPGRFSLLAWIDLDGDTIWDGIWEGDGEPTARFGFEAPRGPLEVPLRQGVPAPYLDDDPEWVGLHDLAWALLADHIAAGTPTNGFADHYLDEAFSAQIFQWDTCLMTLFARYGADAYPVMPSLDNFYGVQTEEGYIGRVVDEDDGEAATPVDASEPMVNPPLFGWAEHEYLTLTGDPGRVARALPVLDAYHDWIDTNLRTEPGLYYTSMLGSGMDNAPRDAAYDGWVDMTAQQALGRRELAGLLRALGDEEAAADAEAEHDRICADVVAWMWDGTWFRDLDGDGVPLPDKTLAGVWPLVAGCADAEQVEVVADTLADPAAFWRPHPFPSTAADSDAFDPDGYYWRGGVWAPTEFATVRGLQANGEAALAYDATVAHLRNLAAVVDRFVPDEDDLAEDAPSDGLGTLWELYAPDAPRPGTRWDATWLGRSEFVGWTGLGPIALLYEQVLGLSPDALTDTLTMTVRRLDHHGIRGYRFGDQLVNLDIGARAQATDPIVVQVRTTDAFTLVLNGQTISIPAGEASWSVSPATPTSLVPGGPFTGSAVLGNGHLAVVVGDDAYFDHVYVGDFGLDVVDGGGTRVVEAGTERPATRVGLDPFFAVYAETRLDGGGTAWWRTFVGADDALIVEGAVEGGPSGAQVDVYPWVDLRAAPDLDGATTTTVTSASGGLTLGVGGQALELRSDPPPTTWGAGDIGLSLDGSVGPGRSAALMFSIEAAAGTSVPFRWTLGTPTDAGLEDARAHWADLEGCTSDRCRIASANLHAAAASRLDGDVPADLTGQFTTNDFPQLYPRDAMMVARALVAVGRTDEARTIVETWLTRDGPEPGAWFARYDARGRAVDGGTGAAFDEPEWDSNAYAVLLAEALGPETWTADQQDRLLEGLDFLVAHQDEDGLWTEGGIIEWTGRLPGTAMAAWAGLDAGARLAEAWGDPERAATYRAAGGRTRGGLILLYDGDAERLGDERDGALAMDSSAMFGPVFGFPTGPILARTASTLRAEEQELGGGIRYFDGNDYGQDLFFFTTAAVLYDALLRGEDDAAEAALEWMTASTNRFGLAPERVYASGDGAAPASPLSWCAAELGLVLSADPVTPSLDGVVDPAEYLGAGLVDMDGEEDGAADPVAVYTRWEGDGLVVGVRTAGPPGDVILALAPADGLGPIGGYDLLTEPGSEPGATAEIDLSDCDVCDVSWGDRGVEARIPVGDWGLAPPLQLIVDTGSRLPARGALRTTDDGTVLVTFQLSGAPGVPTLSGDRAELGAWAASAVPLHDDGTFGDVVAGDGTWTTTVRLDRGGRIAWKGMVGGWEGVEFDGDDRSDLVTDVDGNGRVILSATYGTRGETITE